MRVLGWAAAAVLLVLLLGGVGMVAAFAFDRSAPTYLLAAGAVVSVLAWQALRQLEPRRPEHRPVELGRLGSLAVAGVFTLCLVLVRVNPWVLLFAVMVVPVWGYLRRRH